MSDELVPLVSNESRLRLSGGRYDQQGFPIDGLPELIQYERLVLDVAKTLWIQSHPGRKRVPKGFESAIGLRLTGVEKGSVIPVLERPQSESVLPDLDPPSLLHQAQDLIDAAFAEIVRNNRIPKEFPNELSGHFLRVGRTLKGNEALEFGKIGESNFRYTQKIRQRFLTSNQESDFPVDGMLVGRVTALDTNSLNLTITDLSGRQIPGRYSDASLTADLLEVFSMANTAPLVRLECSQTVTAKQQIKSIDDILEIEVFLTSDNEFADDITYLLNIKDGWLDGDGLAPDIIAIEKTRDILLAANEAKLPRAGVFPRTDSGVQIEWITTSDVWTVVAKAEEPYIADYLEVEADLSNEISAVSVDDVITFFASRQEDPTK